MYPITKDVKRFQEFGVAKSDKTGAKHLRDRDGQGRERDRARADESLSQSSLEVTILEGSSKTALQANLVPGQYVSTSKSKNRVILVQDEGSFQAITEKQLRKNRDL